MFYALSPRPVNHLRRQSGPTSSQVTLDRFLGETLTSLAGAAAPKAASVDDQEKTYSLELDVPGLTREQIDIGIEADVVRVASKADAPRSVKAAWRFPLEIDVQASTAKLENGVLTLTLGKKFPVSKISPLTIQ